MDILTTSDIKNWPKDVSIGLAKISPHFSTEVLSPKEKEVYAAFKNTKRKAEFLTARHLFRYMLSQNGWEEAMLSLSKYADGKPFFELKGMKAFVSFSHTKTHVFCAISEQTDIGLDAELCERNISDKLVERITSEEERDVCSALKPVQLWTIKESAVKFLGTGLRTNLEDLTIIPKNTTTQLVRFNNDKLIEICSFSERNHQIALAYQSQ